MGIFALRQNPHLRNRRAGFPLPIGGFPMGRAGVGSLVAGFMLLCSQTPLQLPPSETHGWGESKTGRVGFATMRIFLSCSSYLFPVYP
jgi:hypothetical protein